MLWHWLIVAKIYVIKVYVARPQYEKIKADAKVRGNRTISDYCRSILTGNSLYVEQKIVENNKILKELKERLKEA